MLKNKIIFSLIVLSLFLLAKPSLAEKAIVAKVNNDVITEEDIEKEVEWYIDKMRAIYRKKSIFEFKVALRKRAELKKLIRWKIFEQLAKKLDVKVSEKEVEREIKIQIKLTGGKERYLQALAKRWISLKEQKRRVKHQLLEREVLLKRMGLKGQTADKTKIPADLYVSPKDIKNFYEKNKKKYERPRRVKIRQIYLKFKEFKNRDDAIRLASSIYRRIKEGEDFSQLAKNYSNGPRAETGGEWNYQKRPFMTNEGNLWNWKKKSLSSKSVEIDELIFNMKLGEVTAPIVAMNGIHIIKIVGVIEKHYISFKEAQQQIKEALQDMKFRVFLAKERKKIFKQTYISPPELRNLFSD